MALSMNSALYCWQRLGAHSPSQALSKSTPLLFYVRDKPKLSLNNRRIVLPDNGRQWKDWKQSSTFYSRNRIKTTKYTFHFFAQKYFGTDSQVKNSFNDHNLCFFFLVVLNWFPQVEVFHRAVVVLPLAMVMLATMIKDAVEDFRKYQYDKKISFIERIYDKNCSSDFTITASLTFQNTVSLEKALQNNFSTFKNTLFISLKSS
uniref:P-type ATPase N-terminal domain-containing protein n=1 Tax=Catharus ustulatus TaxID=91951 RepID=A0A8C3Y8C1_CATUS